jgi:hypothetical protein
VDDKFADVPTVMLGGPPQFGTTAGGWNYVSDRVNVTLITGYTGSNQAVVVPSLINGLSVTGIGPYALLTNSSLTNVTIPNSVTRIGYEAFYNCSSLTNATIGKGVTSIGNSAFSGCTSLTVVYFTGNAPANGSTLFDAHNAAVYYLSNTTGWSNTFDGLPTVMLAGPPQFGTTADGWKYVSDQATFTLITGYGASNNAVVIPSVINGLPVTGIGHNSFENNTNMTSVTIPNSITSIGISAFEHCISLSNVTIPNRVTSIGDNAFAHCDSLTSVFFTGNAPAVGSSIFSYRTRDYGGWYYVDDPAIAYYPSGTTGWSNTLARLPTVMLYGPPQFGTTVDGWNYVSDQVQNTLITGYAGSNNVVVIPSLINDLPVTGIGPKAFLSNWSLTSATIPNSVTSIGWSAFYGCGLTEITIPNSITSIGDYAFAACKGLTNVRIPKSVTNIGSSAFATSGLKTLTIPNSVTSIGDYTFFECSLTNVTIGNGVASIGNFAFAGTALTSVMIPNGVTSLGGGAFAGCSWLVSATIGNGVARIGNLTFSGCWQLTNVTIGNGVTNIGDLAFYECVTLSNVTIPDNVTSIGGRAFEDCGGLTSIKIGNGVASIGDGAFYDCPRLSSVTIGNGATRIGINAFAYCSSLTSLTIPGSVTSIGNGAFGFSGLTSVTIPNSVTNIEGAFASCTHLKSIVIPDSVTSIGDEAFWNCTSLTSVYFTGSAPDADLSVFEDGNDPATIYYLPGTLGWSNTFAGRPTALWLPQVLTSDGNFGVRTSQFAFTITWAPRLTVVIEAAASLPRAAWKPIATVTLSDGGTSYFSDPQWTRHPARFYRLRSTCQPTSQTGEHDRDNKGHRHHHGDDDDP